MEAKGTTLNSFNADLIEPIDDGNGSWLDSHSKLVIGNIEHVSRWTRGSVLSVETNVSQSGVFILN